MKKKFKVVTLGCRTNQYESKAYTNQLTQMGLVEAKSREKAQICIVNTCTVTENADKSSKAKIRQLLKENPESEIFVTGCMVENEKNAICAIDSRIKVVSNLDKENLLSYIFIEEPNLPEFKIENFPSHTRAFVKIQDGCNSFCTYCVIPYVRGRSRSRSVSEILDEIQNLIKSGYKEIVLTGINIGDFDGNVVPKAKLSDLIRLVDALPGLERLRVSSIDPDEIDDDLIDAILHGKNTCPSMHIVLQSGSNVILKRMNRKYNVQIFLDTFESLRKVSPEFTATTDLIVGFPGESDIDFQETLDVIEKVQFAKVHMFPYSPRPRTRAALYKDQIPQKVIFERKQKLLRLSEKVAFELRERFLGKTFQVLLESKDEMHPEYISGYTHNFLKVRILQKNLKKNQLVQVMLRENLPDGYIGEVV